MSRKKAKRPSNNLHHILHYRRWWHKGYKQRLRKTFAYELPVRLHSELHQSVNPVKPLSEEDARWLWYEYRNLSRSLSLFEALVWLEENAPNDEFALSIHEQYEFLHKHKGCL